LCSHQLRKVPGAVPVMFSTSSVTRRQGLRTGEEVPLSHVTVLGEGDHGDGGMVPQHIGPSVHRLLDRLSDTPIAVFDAAWTLLEHNDLWTALIADSRGRSGRSANSNSTATSCRCTARTCASSSSPRYPAAKQRT
jgi:hypothetical protein